MQSVRLYQSTDGLHVFVMAAEIIYLLFIIYYMILQVGTLRSEIFVSFIACLFVPCRYFIYCDFPVGFRTLH